MQQRGAADAPPVVDADERRRFRRGVVQAALRVLLVTGALVAVYVTAPVAARLTGAGVARLIVSLLLLGAVLGWQLRQVTRSPYPTVRGVEAVAVSVPLLVLTFATAYVRTSSWDVDAFTEPVSRLDGVYFSTTILTTVGFGDIAARSDVARALVTSQLVVDLVLTGFVAKVLVGAVRRRREALQDDRGG